MDPVLQQSRKDPKRKMVKNPILVFRSFNLKIALSDVILTKFIFDIVSFISLIKPVVLRTLLKSVNSTLVKYKTILNNFYY